MDGTTLDLNNSTTSHIKVFANILVLDFVWPTVRKNGSSDQEKLLKFKAEGQEFAKILRSLEQFVRTVKGHNNFW